MRGLRVESPAALRGVGLAEALARAQRRDARTVDAPPEAHAGPADVLPGIAQVRQLPVEHGAQAVVWVDDKVAEAVVAVNDDETLARGHLPAQPAEPQLERRMGLAQRAERGLDLPQLELHGGLARRGTGKPVERRGATVGRRIRDLGSAAGSERTGLRVSEVLPGKLNVPPHCHSAEEEIFVVLEGEGALLLWRGDEGPEERPVRTGHTIARPPGSGVAHAFRGGPRGMTLLMYGTREPNDICYYPRSGKIFFCGVGLVGRVERLDYWDGED